MSAPDPNPRAVAEHWAAYCRLNLIDPVVWEAERRPHVQLPRPAAPAPAPAERLEHVLAVIPAAPPPRPRE